MELEHKLSLTTDTNHSTDLTCSLPTAPTTVPTASTTPASLTGTVADGQVDDQEQGHSREVERDLREQLKRAWMTINEQDALVHQGTNL